MKRYTIVCLVFLVLCIHTTASPEPVLYLGIEQGLSNNTVTAIYKDRFGFMWFGTLDGLNRFDGYTFQQFRNRSGDLSSLPNDRITALSEDNTGNLWVGTEKGIGILSNKTLQFSNIFYTPYGDRSGKTQLFDKDVKDIKRDKNGNTFICSSDLGLLFYGNNSKEAIQIPLIGPDSRKLPQYSATAITIDSENNAWLLVDQVVVTLDELP